MDITSRVRGLLGTREGFVPLHEPEFLGEEEALVLDCIRSGWVSSVGQYVDRFEARDRGSLRHSAWCRRGQWHCRAGGGAARGGSDGRRRGAMPSLTFIATANAAHHLGAVPHFVDAEARTLGLDPVALRAHLEDPLPRRSDCERTAPGGGWRRWCPMHVFGHPVDMDALAEVATRLRPCAGRGCGGIAGQQAGERHAAVWAESRRSALTATRFLTTGGGGAVVTDDP